MDCEEEQGYLIGTPEWSAFMHGFFIAGLARLQVSPPSPTPLQAASLAAIRRLMEIEREIGKGAAAHPIVVANVRHLRRVYYRRLAALGKLWDALIERAEDDELYVVLDALDAKGTKMAAQESVQGENVAELLRQDLPATSPINSPFGEADQPTVLPQHNPIRATALKELHLAAKIMNKISMTPLEQTELDARKRVEDCIKEALIGGAENADTASDSAGTAAPLGANKAAAAETIAPIAREPQPSPPSGDEILTPMAKYFQSSEKPERIPSAEATTPIKPAGIEDALQDGIKRILELKRLETAWCAVSPKARDEFRDRLMNQPLDPEHS